MTDFNANLTPLIIPVNLGSLGQKWRLDPEVLSYRDDNIILEDANTTLDSYGRIRAEYKLDIGATKTNLVEVTSDNFGQV